MADWFSPRLCVAAAIVAVFALATLTGADRSSSAMAAAATKFLASLTPEQRKQATFDFSSDERLHWHFIPTETFPRKGLTIKEMNESQRGLAHDLIKAGLSQRGYLTATSIMDLEKVLGALEAAQRAGAAQPPRNAPLVRDPERYFFSVFGAPSTRDTWGWRVEGHHLSLNFTLAEGQLVASSPAFFGSNPAEVREGPRKGLRTLAGEEDRARDLLQSLDDKQLGIAVISKEAPKEILSANSRKADVGPPVGLPAAKMTKRQTDLLVLLLEEYINNMPADVASARMDQVRRAGIEKIHFAWAGVLERGQKHYYRVQGPTFLVEYDNFQNDANHIHAVWRNFEGDFGADLLGQHLRESHSKGGQHRE